MNIEGLFPSSGQPSEAELQLICSAGYSVVVNLAPTSVLENSVIREAEILEQNGVNYVHLPVDFKHPTDEDFGRFVEALWVHCAANMRVSAFTYRHRIEECGDDGQIARQDLQRIWEPFGVWESFIRRVP